MMDNQTARETLRRVAQRTAGRARIKVKDGHSINQELDELEDIIDALVDLLPPKGLNENTTKS